MPPFWRKHGWFSMNLLWIKPYYICALILLQFIDKSTVQEISNVVLKRCPDFQDNRNSTSDSDEALLTIPGNLTSSDETVHFIIDKNPHHLKCIETFLKNFSWEDGESLKVIKSNSRGVRLRHSGKNSSHFTHDGFFHSKRNYYRPVDFCVKSISDLELQLQVCSIRCSDPDRICVPKCCGPDEVLVYWNFTCQRVSPPGQKWKAQLHRAKYPHREITENEELDRIHIRRHHPGCDFFESWPLSPTLRPRPPRPGKEDQPGFTWKLLPNKRPIFYNSRRKWIHLPEGGYCVDGFANWGRSGNGTYSGDRERHSVILICRTDNYTLDQIRSDGQFKEERAWTYSLFLVVSSIFPLLTVIVHLLLIDTQHVHGLTVLCYAASVFILYIFLALAHFINIFPSLKGEPRQGFCLVVAVLAHYSYMTTFTWLTVMNFDLWLTFRSMRPVSRMSKKMRKFSIYFCIGWGLPAVLSAAFYAVDFIYRDSKDEVMVPDYANTNCFVGTHSRDFYFYPLIALALSLNTVIVLWTFYIFYDFHQQSVNVLKTKRSQSEKYSARIFTKLFCVMGVAWLMELVSWHYNGEDKPWFVIVLDCFKFLQSFAVFFIFCINRRTLKQLEEKYACLRSAIGPIRRHQWFQDHAAGADTPAYGSSLRKLSANTKFDSTLPRSGSISSNKISTSRKESIPLESEFKAVGRMEPINEISEPSQSQAPDLPANS